MKKSSKYLILAAVILVAFITVIYFASEIQVWMVGKLNYLLILVIIFVVGWLLGRFGGRKRNREEQNARNITEAQKK